MDEINYERETVEEDTLFDQVSDEGLERAAETGVFTLGNCTGLESCPA